MNQKTKSLQHKLDLEFYTSLPKSERKQYYWHNGKNRYRQEKRAIIEERGLSQDWERCSIRYIKTHTLPNSWENAIGAVLLLLMFLIVLNM